MTLLKDVVKPRRGRGWWMRGWSRPSHPGPGAFPVSPGVGRGGYHHCLCNSNPIQHKTNVGFQKKPKKTTSSCVHFYKLFKHMSLWEECKRAGRPISWMDNQYDDARLGDNPEGTTALRAPYLNFRFNKTAGFLHLFHINCCLALSPAHTSPPVWMKSA